MLRTMLRTNLTSANKMLGAAMLALAMSPATLLGRGGDYCRRASLVEQCLANDSTETVKAVAALRADGQAGLDAICAEYDRLAESTTDSERIRKLRTLIDTVAKQRDAYASRLFWYTDLDAALKQAQASHKPVLSLRLLGNLDEDLSCANSRFFRSVLYANAEVSHFLREHYVLHWQSLRPVPRITIDMGDGRQIRRTITGNSIHYVLNSRGELVDGIPGLVSPTAFLRGLKAAEAAAVNSASINVAEDRRSFLRDYHDAALGETDREWQNDLAKLRGENSKNDADKAAIPGLEPAAAQKPTATIAAPVAMTKMRDERPVLAALFASHSGPPASLNENDLQLWNLVAQLHFPESSLDASSIALMRTKAVTGTAQAANVITESKRQVEDPFIVMLYSFRQSLATDTVRNQYVIHRQIHQWLATNASINVEEFNRAVYDNLFRSPLDDPWMGLAPADVYAALDQNGLALNCKWHMAG